MIRENWFLRSSSLYVQKIKDDKFGIVIQVNQVIT